MMREMDDLERKEKRKRWIGIVLMLIGWVWFAVFYDAPFGVVACCITVFVVGFTMLVCSLFHRKTR